MTYRQLVTQYLQALRDAGLTQRQIAARIGLTNGSYVSMLMNPHGADILALKRLPALATACGLSPRETVQLVLLLARDHPKHQSTLDLATMKWLMSSTLRFRNSVKAPLVAGVTA